MTKPPPSFTAGPDAVAAEFARIGKLFDEQLKPGPKPPAIIVPDREPHRDHHVYALGAVLYPLGVRQPDADALMGLLDLPLDRLTLLLSGLRSPRSLAQALPALVAAHQDELVARGKNVSWTRRWMAYQQELASWLAQDEELRVRGTWRSKPMSANQGHLVRVTAVLLGVLIPLEMSRGEAADWLASHGANLSFMEA